MHRLCASFAVAAIGAALFVSVAAAERGPYPHEFKQNNMGYCAPFLAQQRLPNGDPVRPFINHVVQAATAGDGTFDGAKNLGDFYNDKAQSTTDTQCLQRQ